MFKKFLNKLIHLIKHIQELIIQIFIYKKSSRITKIIQDRITYNGQFSDLKIDSIKEYNNKLNIIVSLARSRGNQSINILDIGANIGVYSIGFAKNDNTNVFSFEPYYKTYDLLYKNIIDNNFNNIEHFNYGLYDRDVELNLGSPKHKSKYMSFFKYFDRYSLGSKTIYTNEEFNESDKKSSFFIGDNLDVINKLKSIDIIKIDVEGAEYAVMKGLKKILEKHKPILCIESNSGYKNDNNDIDKIILFLLSLGFKKVIEFSKISNVSSFENSIPLKSESNLFKRSTDLIIY